MFKTLLIKVAVFSLLSLALLPTQGLMAVVEKKKENCLSSREYITTLEFLRNYSKDQAPQREKENRKLADLVSKNCTGAASRFIKIILLFDKLELGINNAIKVGLMTSEKSEKQVDIFVKIFKRLYLKDGFDLKAQSAFDLSKRFLFDTLVDLDDLEEEVDKLMDYCLNTKGLSLNKYQCAELSWKLVASLDSKEAKISGAFIDFYEYLTESSSPGMSSYEAIKLASRLILHGPNALENFKQAAVYAQKKEGLNLSRDKAVDFASEMAKRSQRLVSVTE